ncbi:hypothetical protein PCASD_20513, partial [Puccinia coronata f. sp. avenae]
MNSMDWEDDGVYSESSVQQTTSFNQGRTQFCKRGELLKRARSAAATSNLAMNSLGMPTQSCFTLYG